MDKKNIVRIIETQIENFKNVNYDTYGGMFDKEKPVKLTTLFYMEENDEKYKAQYEVCLKRVEKDKKIQITSEKLTYWSRGKEWNAERILSFQNPFYDMDNVQAEIELSNKKMETIRVLESVKNLAIVCAQSNTSLFFNKTFIKAISAQKPEEMNEEENVFGKVVEALYRFADLRFQVVKVNQLGANYEREFIPVNIHEETEHEILQGCLPLFLNGRGEFPEEIYARLEKSVEAINIALKAIIPNLRIEIDKVEEELNKEGKKLVKAEVYSVRDGKKFLTKYESEGIKRIISLLNYLIFL